MKENICEEHFLDHLYCVENRILSNIDEFKEWFRSWKEHIIKDTKESADAVSNTFTHIDDHNNTEVLHLKKTELSKKRDECLLKLKQLENKEDELRAEISQCATDLQLYQDCLSKNSKDVTSKCRDLCKVSKELLKTSFNYEGQDVTGFIVGTGEHIEAFKINTKDVSAEEVSNNMWKYVCKASGEDCDKSIDL